MKHLLTYSLGLFFLTSCGNSTQRQEKEIENIPTSETEHVSTPQAETIIPTDLDYKILKETKNEPISKCNLYIQLSRKTTERELTALAKKIRETRKKYNHLWIFYTLDEAKFGSATWAWATTHFTPELKVEIVGATAEQENNSNKLADNIYGKQIGKWFEQQATSGTYLLYEKGNRFFMKTTFKDGQSMETKVIKKKVSKGLQLTDPEDNNGEYYIISKTGDLEFYNKQNKKFATGQVVK